MYALLIVLPLLTQSTFNSNVEAAIGFAESGDWARTAAALDQSALENPALFDANNLMYLRGRAAESQNDWQRALKEFDRIDSANSLRPLAAFHSANAAIKLGDFERAAALIAEVPADFPPDMKIQLAREGPPQLTEQILKGVTSRVARLLRASATGDKSALWALLREN